MLGDEIYDLNNTITGLNTVWEYYTGIRSNLQTQIDNIVITAGAVGPNPLGELNFRMENLILDDVNLFVVKGIKYRAMSSGIISGKPMHIIESVGSGVCWKN